MLTTSCNSVAAQSSRGAVRFADTVGRGLGLFLLLVSILFLSPVVCAQSQTEIKDAGPTGKFGMAETAPVVVNGKVRFHVVGVSAYPAERRAHEIARRIEALAQDPTFDPKTLRIEDVGAYHQIFPGESRKAILSVLEADAESEGVTRTVLVDAGIEDFRIHDLRHTCAA